jgi:hypothetical protein
MPITPVNAEGLPKLDIDLRCVIVGSSASPKGREPAMPEMDVLIAPAVA